MHKHSPIYKFNINMSHQIYLGWYLDNEDQSHNKIELYSEVHNRYDMVCR